MEGCPTFTAFTVASTFNPNAFKNELGGESSVAAAVKTGTEKNIVPFGKLADEGVGVPH